MLWQRSKVRTASESRFAPLVDALLIAALVLFCTLATAVSECGDVQAAEQSQDCVVVIAAFPRAAVYLGGPCEPPYVGNVPDGWPLLRGPGTWPTLIPGSCSWVGICKWMAILDRRECLSVRNHSMVEKIL